MNDGKFDLGEDGGMKLKKGRFAGWLENYFYHYKWHTLAAIFVIIAVLVCSIQMCSKESVDVYIMYAGQRDIKSIRLENDVQEYTKVQKSLSEAVRDFDEDGSVNISLEALYMLSNDEILKIEEEIAEKKANGEEVEEINLSVLVENNQIFKEKVLYSEYYVCILSESLYNAYKVVEGVKIFVPLESFVKKGGSVSYLDDSAIYLNSLDFGKLPGLSQMPDDTVVALRSMSAVSAHFNKKDNEELYERSKEVIENILNYEY